MVPLFLPSFLLSRRLLSYPTARATPFAILPNGIFKFISFMHLKIFGIPYSNLCGQDISRLTECFFSHLSGNRKGFIRGRQVIGKRCDSLGVFALDRQK